MSDEETTGSTGYPRKSVTWGGGTPDPDAPVYNMPPLDLDDVEWHGGLTDDVGPHRFEYSDVKGDNACVHCDGINHLDFTHMALDWPIHLQCPWCGEMVAFKASQISWSYHQPKIPEMFLSGSGFHGCEQAVVGSTHGVAPCELVSTRDWVGWATFAAVLLVAIAVLLS